MKAYFNWLFDNQESILAEDNAFFKVHVYLELASAKYAENEHNDACMYIDSTFTLFQKVLFPKVYEKINKIGATISFDKADAAKTIEYYSNILKLDIVKSDPELLAEIYMKLADQYLYDQQYDNCMHYCSLAYPLLKEQNKIPDQVKLLLDMYNSSFFTSEDTTCLEYLHRAVDMALNYGDSILISTSYEELGKSFYRRGNHSEAIKFYKIARNWASDKGSKREVRIAVMQHLSNKYIPDSIEAACELSDYILTQSIKNKDIKLLSNAYLSRANCFAKHGEKDSAIYYLERSEENRIAYGNANSANGYYYVMYEVALSVKAYEHAMRYLQISTEQTVEARMETNTNELTETRAKLDYQIQKEQIIELQYQNELQQEKNKRQKTLILAIFVILVLGVSFMGYAYRKYNELKSSYREVFRKNIELDKLSRRLFQTEEKLQINKNSSTNGNGNGNGNGGIRDEEKIYLKLKQMLEVDKIYKQTDISASKLARKLKTNTSYLSIIINSRFEESFKSLINRYRINEARELLSSPHYSNFSIEGIAEEVGFNSRSAFYQSFKQITGLTPTQYLQNLKDIPEKKR